MLSLILLDICGVCQYYKYGFIGSFLEEVTKRENDTVKSLEETPEMLINDFQICVNGLKTNVPDVKSYVPGKFKNVVDVNNLSDKVNNVKIEREKNKDK